ncbi:unnamed protein product [Schistosoma margrebowiei]|uniref:Uncharacterized protein n=1 Tax=Schistosoma margrebowiei TaxID=48269 RepID=A0A183MNV4_9TREM|nr:unnamed protein product [Schistosoma margrebowiei]
MWETGRVFQIAAEIRRYNLEVLGISKTHWTQVGQQRLASGELLLYSGHEEENAAHTQRVALMLSKQTQKAPIGWESHGPRIIKAFFKTKKEGITMNTSIEENTQLRHKASPHMESSKPKEKRNIGEHITPGNENRHGKNE